MVNYDDLIKEKEIINKQLTELIEMLNGSLEGPKERRLDQILNKEGNIADRYHTIRLYVQSLLHDLESTKRENMYLISILESFKDSEDHEHDK